MNQYLWKLLTASVLIAHVILSYGRFVQRYVITTGHSKSIWSNALKVGFQVIRDLGRSFPTTAATVGHPRAWRSTCVRPTRCALRILNSVQVCAAPSHTAWKGSGAGAPKHQPPPTHTRPNRVRGATRNERPGWQVEDRHSRSACEGGPKDLPHGRAGHPPPLIIVVGLRQHGLVGLGCACRGWCPGAAWGALVLVHECASTAPGLSLR